jgi:predicted PurR-regulated permease PerM
MQFQYHANVAFGALRRWFIAQLYDSLIIGTLWFIALRALHVPWAPFWAFLAAGLQLIPHFGSMFAIIGPALAMLLSGATLRSWFYLLGMYVAIAVVDGLLLQPFLMHRQNRVPFWASIFAPLVLGFIFPFWGVLLAPPVLAIIYGLIGAPRPSAPSGEQRFSPDDSGIIIAPGDDQRHRS